MHCTNNFISFYTACVLRHTQTAITGHNNLAFKGGVATEGKCVRLCIQETSFICRSVEYVTRHGVKGICQLSVDNLASVDMSDHKSWNNNNLSEICEYL